MTRSRRHTHARRDTSSGTSRGKPRTARGTGVLVGASLAFGLLLATPPRGAAAVEPGEPVDRAAAAPAPPTDEISLVAAPAWELAQTEYQRRLIAGRRPHLHRIGRALSVSSLDPHSGRVDTSLYLDQGDHTLVSHHLSHALLEPATEPEFEALPGATGHAQHVESSASGHTRRFVSYVAPANATEATRHHQQRLTDGGFSIIRAPSLTAGRTSWSRGEQRVELLITDIPSTDGAPANTASVTIIVDEPSRTPLEAAAKQAP